MLFGGGTGKTSTSGAKAQRISPVYGTTKVVV
jgi:hypothetical protein